MKLVMCWHEGDGCTYSCANVEPIEYEDPKTALMDFVNLINSDKHEDGQIEFANRRFSKSSFFERHKFYPPTFYALEEWFGLYVNGDLD
jgi:hypothetical protein